MAVFRIKTNKNYTNMSNYHFRDKNLSWKAKGILSNMLSLPADWDYSLAGLATLASDGMSATRTAIKELEEHDYLIRRPIRKNGKISDWEYIIFECPAMKQEFEKSFSGKQVVENQQIENSTQLNTKQSITKKSITKELNNNIDENFENLWKLLKSHPNDRKSKVTKKRKKELYEMGDRAEKAIKLYLQVQDPNYYHKRDNILNEIIDNFLDKTKEDFAKSEHAKPNNNDQWCKDENRDSLDDLF